MAILATNQTLTRTWADLGSSINTVGRSFVTIFLDVDINDSANVQIKQLAVNESDRFEMPLSTVKKSVIQIEPDIRELNLDIDQKIAVEFELDMTIETSQIQVRVGTVGATPGVIINAFYEVGYRQ
jgi:hypothetical protein